MALKRSDNKIRSLIFSWLYWQYRSPLTRTAFDMCPSSILTCSGMAVQCLSVEKVLDMSGGVCELVIKRKHGTSRSDMPPFLFVLNSVTMPPKHMENFSRPLETMRCQKHKPFAGKNVFCRQNSSWRWTAQRMTIRKAVKWQHSTGKKTFSIWLKINSQNDCWWSEHVPENRSFYTEWRIGDEKILCQNGAQESHRATAVERSFWHPNALRWGCSLLTHLLSHLATSFYFKK